MGRRRHGGPAGPIEFVAVDGEGITGADGRHQYVLSGSSSGKTLYRNGGLSTITAFEYLLAEKATRPKAVFVSFAFTYDVNMMLRDLAKPELATLWKRGKVRWQAGPHISYVIEWRPHKMVSIYCGGRFVKVYDVWGFFQSSFLKAITAWNVGTPEQRERIEKMKAERGEFDIGNLAEIRAYCVEECELLSQLCNRLYRAFEQAEIIPHDWHGPGAVAATVLRQRIRPYYQSDDLYPKLLNQAIRSAYFGGRVEIFQQGLIGKGVNYDVRSAYPYAATYLPSLAGGAWEPKRKRSAEMPFSLWLVEWETDRNVTPFPFRYKGEIYWPAIGSGWYHEAEIRAAEQAGYDFKVKKGWQFHPRTQVKPFAFVRDYYAAREAAKARGDAAEKAYKLALNSLYGKLAQGYGYNGKKPPFQSYYWAGLITSITRAKMLELLERGKDCGPIYVATDSVCFERSPSFRVGTDLGSLERGQWDDLFVIQNGIYHGRNKEGEYARSRGFFLRDLDFTTIRADWERDGFLGRYEHTSRRFFGLGTALMRKDFSIWQQWGEMPKALSFSVRPKKWYEGLEPNPSGREVLLPPTMQGVSEPYQPKKARFDEAAIDFVTGVEQPDLVEHGEG
jgi:DNA polymerase type B, organellar and viral